MAQSSSGLYLLNTSASQPSSGDSDLRYSGSLGTRTEASGSRSSTKSRLASGYGMRHDRPSCRSLTFCYPFNSLSDAASLRMAVSPSDPDHRALSSIPPSHGS